MSALENMVSCNYEYVQLSRREGHVGWSRRERTGMDLRLEMWGPRWGRQGFQQALSKACIQGTCNKTTRPLLDPRPTLPDYPHSHGISRAAQTPGMLSPQTFAPAPLPHSRLLKKLGKGLWVGQRGLCYFQDPARPGMVGCKYLSA